MIELKDSIKNLKGIKELKLLYDISHISELIFDENLYKELILDNMQFWSGLTKLKIVLPFINNLELLRIFQILLTIKIKNSSLDIELVSKSLFDEHPKVCIQQVDFS